MLTVNIDMKDHLNNGQTGIIRYVEFTLGSDSKA